MLLPLEDDLFLEGVAHNDPIILRDVKAMLSIFGEWHCWNAHVVGCFGGILVIFLKPVAVL